MLTGNKDVDRKILNNLEDKDLVKFCMVDKKAQLLCNDQVFWMNRVFLKFGYVGGDVLRKNKKDRSWSEYYIQDLRKINSTNADYYIMARSGIGRLDQVMIALKNGANVNSDISWIGLKNAAFWGHLDVIKYWVSQGADVHVKDDMVLRVAKSNGKTDVVKYLEDMNAQIK